MYYIGIGLVIELDHKNREFQAIVYTLYHFYRLCCTLSCTLSSSIAGTSTKVCKGVCTESLNNQKKVWKLLCHE